MQGFFASLILIFVLSAGAALLFRWHQRRAPESSGDTQATLDYTTMWVGVVYAIMLGLSVVAVWETRQGAEDAVRAEAVAVAKVRDTARELPEPHRTAVIEAVDAYDRSVVDDEWPAMRGDGEMSETTARRFAELQEVVSGFDPQDQREISAYRVGLDGLSTIATQRAERAEYVQDGADLSAYIWFGLIAGAIITVGFVFTYPTDHGWTQVAGVVGMCIMMSFLLYFIWGMSAPFSRIMPLAPEGFTALGARK
ncbi:hypothetical protein [Streptomyces sp. NPDC006879]|uniref:bestrophin-like domain n=1 Tax=Streptomyces sp. NPDC006879 TaxID=3364767 RepID=UPI00367EBB7C